MWLFGLYEKRKVSSFFFSKKNIYSNWSRKDTSKLIKSTSMKDWKTTLNIHVTYNWSVELAVDNFALRYRWQKVKFWWFRCCYRCNIENSEFFSLVIYVLFRAFLHTLRCKYVIFWCNNFHYWCMKYHLQKMKKKKKIKLWSVDKTPIDFVAFSYKKVWIIYEDLF